MPRLSIIIPALGDDGPLEQTIGSVLRHRPADCEVLVVHDGDYADPYQLGDEIRFVSAPRGASMVARMNAGLAEARGPLAHFLRPGCEVAEHWADIAAAHFSNPSIAAVAPQVSASSGERVVTGWCYERRGVRKAIVISSATTVANAPPNGSVAAPLSRAAFFRATPLRAIGGFDDTLSPEWAMVDAALAIVDTGELTTRCEGGSRIVSDEAPDAESAGFYRRARDAERVFWRRAGSRGLAATAASHGVHVAGELLHSTLNLSSPIVLCGRAIGALMSFGRREAATRQQEEAMESDETRAAAHERIDREANRDPARAWREDRSHPPRETRASHRVSVR